MTRSSVKDEIHDEQKTPTQGDELRKLKSNWSSKHPRCATTGAIRYNKSGYKLYLNGKLLANRGPGTEKVVKSALFDKDQQPRMRLTVVLHYIASLLSTSAIS